MKNYCVRWLEQHERVVEVEDREDINIIEQAIEQALEEAGGHDTSIETFDFRVQEEE